ncbi:hypothetical protein Tco_0260555 [Tanacetum coccineum]
MWARRWSHRDREWRTLSVSLAEKVVPVKASEASGRIGFIRSEKRICAITELASEQSTSVGMWIDFCAHRDRRCIDRDITGGMKSLDRFRCVYSLDRRRSTCYVSRMETSRLVGDIALSNYTERSREMTPRRADQSGAWSACARCGERCRIERVTESRVGHAKTLRVCRGRPESRSDCWELYGASRHTMLCITQGPQERMTVNKHRHFNCADMRAQFVDLCIQVDIDSVTEHLEQHLVLSTLHRRAGVYKPSPTNSPNIVYLALESSVQDIMGAQSRTTKLRDNVNSNLDILVFRDQLRNSLEANRSETQALGEEVKRTHDISGDIYPASAYLEDIRVSDHSGHGWEQEILDMEEGVSGHLLIKRDGSDYFEDFMDTFSDSVGRVGIITDSVWHDITTDFLITFNKMSGRIGVSHGRLCMEDDGEKGGTIGANMTLLGRMLVVFEVLGIVSVRLGGLGEREWDEVNDLDEREVLSNDTRGGGWEMDVTHINTMRGSLTQVDRWLNYAEWGCGGFDVEDRVDAFVSKSNVLFRVRGEDGELKTVRSREWSKGGLSLGWGRHSSWLEVREDGKRGGVYGASRRLDK